MTNLNFNIAIVQNVPINDHRMVHTDGVARELVKRGYDVEVIIQESKGESPFKDPPYKVTYIPGETYSIRGQLKFGYELFKLLKKRNYDIIHAKNPFSSVLPALLMRPKFKVIYDMRGLWVDFGVHAGTIPGVIAHFLNRFDVFCMNKADRVIAISHELKKILVRRGVKEQKIEVIIGGGVDIEKIRKLKNRDIRDVLGIDGKVIGYVGGIGRSRSSERIIEAFEILKKKSKIKVNLVMIGPFGKDDFEYFKKLVKKKYLEGSVYFTGLVPHDKALAYMKSFNVSVSYHERDLPIYNVAVPTKILEYLAAGCSIVTTDQIMYKNILTHKKDAFLTRQNINSFAEGIIHVLEDEKLSKKLSKNAFISSKKHSLERITNTIEYIYRDIYGKNSKQYKSIKKRIIRVALIGNYLKESIGGPAEHTRNLVDELSKHPEIELYVISKGEEDKIIKTINLTIHLLKHFGPYPFNEFIHSLRVRNKISLIDPDIVHFQGTSPYALFNKKRPWLSTIHGIFYLEVPERFQGWRYVILGLPRILLEKMVFAKAENIIAVSPYIGKIINSKINARIRVIPNGVDDAFFCIRYKEESGHLLFVGCIEPRKGLLNLLKAIKIVKRSVPLVKLIIVGKKTDLEYFRKITYFIVNEGLINNVIYKGTIEKRDLIKEYQRCSIFVLPSKIEPFGIVLLEAMASEKPVIATNVGGIPYVVHDRESGFLVKAGDVDALADRILLLLEHEDLRRKMGKKGREIAKRFKWQSIAQETVDFYYEILVYKDRLKFNYINK